VPGNHENWAQQHPGAWTTAFGPGSLQYERTVCGWRFIALDSCMPRLAPGTLDWLRGVLESDKETPTVLLVHHPLSVTKAVEKHWMAKHGGALLLAEATEVLALVREHTSVRAVLSGHAHFPSFVTGRFVQSIGPALIEKPPQIAVLRLTEFGGKIRYVPVR
jgi:hypothetical protein